MEELERNIFPTRTVLGAGGHSNGNIVCVPSDPSNTEDNASRFEMHQICRGCLRVSNLTNMQDIADVASLNLYKEISKIKVECEILPVMLCEYCVLELSKMHKFIKMLRYSYTILMKAAKEIRKLNEQGNMDMDKYIFKKTSIIRNVLKEKSNELHVEDLRSLHEEPESENHELSDNALSDGVDDIFSVHNESGSSDDEIPLSERFKMNLNKEKDNKTLKRTKKRDNGPKKRHVKCKENLEKVSNNNTALSNDLPHRVESQIKEGLNLYDTCCLCSKKIRYLVKHLQSVHSVDWLDSSCLKCSYRNTVKDKLIEHCRGCTKTEPEYDHPDYVESEDLKLEWNEEIEDKEDECDADFDEFAGGDTKELDYEDREDEMEDLKKDDSSRKKRRNRKYNCNKCEDISFEQYNDIESHLKSVHSTESKCILCDQEFTNSFSLLYHVMVKHGKLKCCRLCLVSFKNSEDLNAHYKSEEHNTRCTVCGEQFKNRKALYEHRRKKHLNPQLENQKYKCPECPKEFANQNNIRRHIMVAHNDLRFLCDTCGQSYTTKRNLKLHIQKFHEGVQVQHKNTKKNFFCEACGRELKIFHKYAIAMHRAKHKGHNLVCKKCYDSFATEEDFKRHVEDLGHQLYECDKCQSQFVREENLKTHLKNHEAPGWNKNMFATWGKSAKLRNEKGEFVCSYCPKVFKDKQRLDNHVRVHTNERPYKCHICSKGFKTWIHRKTHLNIHLGIKKWVCKFCSKAFTNSCTLKGHEMIHTGERPHRCPECKKGFITMSAMKKHRMVHFRTSGASYGKKENSNAKDEDKSDSEREESAEFIYKYGQMFTGSDVSYESFAEPPKEPPVSLVSIEKELSC